MSDQLSGEVGVPGVFVRSHDHRRPDERPSGVEAGRTAPATSYIERDPRAAASPAGGHYAQSSPRPTGPGRIFNAVLDRKSRLWSKRLERMPGDPPSCMLVIDFAYAKACVMPWAYVEVLVELHRIWRNRNNLNYASPFEIHSHAPARPRRVPLFRWPPSVPH